MSQTEIAIAKPQGMTRDEVRDLFKEFTNNRGLSPEQGGAQLMADNAILREDKRRLKADLEAIQALVPPTGSVVLKGDDLKLYNDLRALLQGEQKPEDIAKMRKEHGELKNKITSLEKNQLAVQIAEAEDWKVSVLMKLTEGMDLVVEEVEEDIEELDENGKKKRAKVTRGFVQAKDATGVLSKKRLSDELKIFLPALVKDEGQNSDEERSESNESGTPFVRQSQGNKGALSKANPSQSYIDRKYKLPDKK